MIDRALVGRTTFWNPLADCLAQRGTREQAVSRIVGRHHEWATIFERPRP